MPQCLICQAAIEPFMSFGRMPIANGFLSPAEYSGEFFFDLQVGHCGQCHMVQLTELVDPSKLFHEHYAYFSSISTRMAEHFRLFADAVRRDYLPGADPFVVEIGSNDGIMLQHFAKAGLRHTTEALRLDPKDGCAQFDYGLALMDQGKLDEAVTHISEAVRLLPEGFDQRYCQAEMNYMLGEAFSRKGMGKEAAQALGISSATVRRDWVTAKAWLFDRLSRNPGISRVAE